MSCAPLFSPDEEDEYAIQTGPMYPHSRASIERGKRLSQFLARTENCVWVEGHGVWSLVPKDWCKQAVNPNHGSGWSVDRAKRRSGDASRRGRPRAVHSG